MTRQESDSRRDIQRVAALALVIGLLPIIAINCAYVVAAYFEAVPLCFPYVDGCTSISSTGRTQPSAWIFKPVMLASAACMVLFFVKAAQLTRPDPGTRRDTLALLGIVAAAALVLYVVFLGTEGPVYRLLRRYGVTLYFGFTYLAQLLMARRLLRRVSPAAPHYARWMLGVCGLLLVIGVVSIPISNFVADKDRIENVIEWNFALLMQLNFLLVRQALLGLRPADDERSVFDDSR